MPRSGVLTLIWAVASNCGSDAAPGLPDGPRQPTDGPGDGRQPDASLCPRLPPAAGSPHYAVVAHPFTAAGDSSPDYELLRIEASGVVRTGSHFSMRRATIGGIDFSADGVVGLSPQSDGSIGVFTVIDGAVTVQDPGWQGIAASHVIRATDGELYVFDGNTVANGGGIYHARLGCDNQLVSVVRILSGSLPAYFEIVGARAFLVAADVPGSLAGTEAHVFAWPLSDNPVPLASVDLFTDNQAIMAGVARSPDGTTLLVGDNNSFSGIPNRVANVGLAGDTLVLRDVLTPLEDPIAIAWTQNGNTALVASGFGNALVQLPGGTQIGSSLATSGVVELPAALAPIRRGPWLGHVVSVEVTRLRLINMANAPDDVQSLNLGDGYEQITGAFGIGP